MAKLEQFDASASAAAAADSIDSKVPSKSDINVARSSGTEAAQKTIDDKFGKPDIEIDRQSTTDSATAANGASDGKETKYLTPDELTQAATESKMTQALIDAGVDVNNTKELDQYLAKAYNLDTINNLKKLGVTVIPDYPPDYVLGQAAIPFVKPIIEKEFGADLAKAMIAKLEEDPGAFHAAGRKAFIEDTHTFLRQEKRAREQGLIPN